MHILSARVSFANPHGSTPVDQTSTRLPILLGRAGITVGRSRQIFHIAHTHMAANMNRLDVQVHRKESLLIKVLTLINCSWSA